MIIDQLFTRPIFEAADPNRLIVLVRIEPMSTGGEPIDKEVDLTGQFQGDARSQINQALDYIKKILESKGLYFTTLKASYQGQIITRQNVGSMEPQNDAERELQTMANQMLNKLRNKRPVQNTAPALKEFAPSDDGDGPDQEELLRRMASHWWNGNERQMAKVENTLAAMGWEIGQDDGYDDGGVFVVRAGDEHGRSYISWPHEDLEINKGMDEGRKKKKKKSSRSLGRYFFPGFGYYGSGESGEGGGDGGGGESAKPGMAEGSDQQLSVRQLATISDEALDKAYGYGRSSPGNTFGWQANLKSAAYAKHMIDKGVTDIDEIADAIHKGWNVTAKAFVKNPDRFDDTEKLKAAGKLEAKLQQRANLMNIDYSQLPNDEQEKDRVVARALLQAITGGGEQDMAEGEYDSRKPFGVRYKVFAGREGRMTTREYWTSSEEKLQRAVDKIQALDNFYEIDGYSYPKESQGVAEGNLKEFAPGGNSASSYYAVTANFVNEFAQQKQEELQDLIDAGWTKQDLAQSGTQEGAATDIAHLEQVRDGFLKGLQPGFDAYLRGDTQLKDQLGEYWIDNDLPLNQDWEKIYGEPWGDDGEFNEGVAEGSEQKPAITYKDYTLQYDYQTEDDDPEGYSTATTYYFDVLKDGDRVGEAEYFDYFGNLTIRINGKTKEFGFRHPLASQISQLVSSLPDEQKKDLSDSRFESQGLTEVFADQGSGSTDRDNADYMKRRNAAKKAGYTGRETKAGTWRVFKDGNAVAAAGPFKSADEAAAWIKKHKQGITEMDKSEPSAGRDTGPRPGPDREAKPITAKKATRDAGRMLNRAFQDSHKKKDVKEGLVDRAAGVSLKLATPELLKMAGFIKAYIKAEAPDALPAMEEILSRLKFYSTQETGNYNIGGLQNLHQLAIFIKGNLRPDSEVAPVLTEFIRIVKWYLDETIKLTNENNDPLMKKLRRALIKEGRVKELADDLKTLNDADFMKKYGKAKAAIRADMSRIDEKLSTSDTLSRPAAGASSSGKAIDDPDIMGSLKSASTPKFDRFSKTDSEPKIDFRAGLVGGEPEVEADPRLMVDPLPDMQKWGGKFATGSAGGDNRFTAPAGWRYVEKDEDPARYGSAPAAAAAGGGLPDLKYDPQSRTLKSADAPALDMSPKSKFKFDRATQSQVPVDGSGANPNIDNATRDRARTYAARQNAPVDAAKKVDWKTIYALNKATIGSNPNLIRPRMQLNMPNGTIYLVQPGDTLTKIAAKQSQIMSEAPKSAAVRLGNAIKRVQGTTAASQARSVIPSSIPKPEPKKDEKEEKEAKKVDESRAARRALMARIVNHR